MPPLEELAVDELVVEELAALDDDAALELDDAPPAPTLAASCRSTTMPQFVLSALASPIVSTHERFIARDSPAGARVRRVFLSPRSSRGARDLRTGCSTTPSTVQPATGRLGVHEELELRALGGSGASGKARGVRSCGAPPVGNARRVDGRRGWIAGARPCIGKVGWLRITGSRTSRAPRGVVDAVVVAGSFIGRTARASRARHARFTDAPVLRGSERTCA